MLENQETSETSLQPFDDFLDRFLRGEGVDPQWFIDTHPALTDDERRQIRTLGASSDTVGSSSEATGDALPVTRLAGYRLVRKIGAGASGAVYLAEEESLGRTVAVKILGPDLLGKGERAERFAREARAVASLRHRNIVTVHAAGEDQGLRWLAMEYLPGLGLDEVLERAAARGSLPPVTDVMRWGVDLANALACAHASGIVHRDLKPSNVRIAEDGRAVLLDFGIARAEDAATLTESGDFRGSPQYASPEQVGVAGVEVDARSDVYALGVTLYELLTGAAPFRAPTREQLFLQILQRDPVAPRRLEPSVPRDLETLVLAMLEKDQRRRPQGAALAAADLEAVRDGRPIATRRISALGRLSRWARREPAKAALALCLAIGVPIVAALGGYIAANQGKIDKASADERAATLAGVLQEAFLEYGEGDPAFAVPVFEEALRIDPDSSEARAGLALALMDSENPSHAIEILEAMPPEMRSAPWHAELRSCAAALRDHKPWAPDSRPSATRTAIDHFVAGILGLRRYHQGHSKTAPQAFEALFAAVLHAPVPSALYHHELGHAAWHAGRKAEARAVAEAIRRQWPGTPETELAVGRTLLSADPETALAALAAAARNPPRGPAPASFLVQQLGHSGRPEYCKIALELGRKTIERYPSAPAPRIALSAVLRIQGDLDEAVEQAREGVRLGPTFGSSNRRLADALIARGDYAEALGPARKAARLKPEDPAAWNALGIAEINSGETDKSVQSFRKALEFWPRDPLTLCNLGRALIKAGEFKEALERLEEGDRIGSKDPAWRYPAKKWIQEASDLIELDERLEDVRRGGGEDVGAAERVRMARLVCRPRRLHAEAVALYEQAFREEPALIAEQSPDFVSEAAASAAAAGAGTAADAPADPAARERLLAQAAEWRRLREAPASRAPASAASRPAPR